MCQNIRRDKGNVREGFYIRTGTVNAVPVFKYVMQDVWTISKQREIRCCFPYFICFKDRS